MARLVRLGRFIINLGRVRKSSGIERTIILTGPDAEKLRAQLNAMAGPWRPVVIERKSRPRGPPDSATVPSDQRSPCRTRGSVNEARPERS